MIFIRFELFFFVATGAGPKFSFSDVYFSPLILVSLIWTIRKKIKTECMKNFIKIAAQKIYEKNNKPFFSSNFSGNQFVSSAIPLKVIVFLNVIILFENGCFLLSIFHTFIKYNKWKNLLFEHTHTDTHLYILFIYTTYI